MFLTTPMFDHPFTTTTHTDDASLMTNPPVITKGSRIAPLAARNIDTMTVSSPAQADILCGKDKTYAKHVGNQRFRKCIQDYVGAYQACAANKPGKMKITKEIVYTLQTVHSARFLKKSTTTTNDGADIWLEISNQIARDKTSHALRFAANKGRSSQSRSAKKKHRRHVSADSASSSLSDDAANSCHYSVAAVAFAAVAPEHEHKPASMEIVVTVQTLFERQQGILMQLHKDVEAAAAAKKNGTAIAAPVADGETTHHVEPEHDNFNTLRSEDLDRLMSEPLDEAEWENVLQLTR